jgi:hypothetical protein
MSFLILGIFLGIAISVFTLLLAVLGAAKNGDEQRGISDNPYSSNQR